VLVSGILQSDSVIHIHICILLENLTSYKLSQNIEFPALYSRSLLVIYLTYSSMYMHPKLLIYPSLTRFLLFPLW